MISCESILAIYTKNSYNSYDYYRCEEYVISLLEQCEDLGKIIVIK